MRKKIVAGNWKMNKTFEAGLQLVDEIIKELDAQPASEVLKIIAPPYIHLAAIAEKVILLNEFGVASQNCHHLANGAYTGEVSTEMIVSTGAKYVIVGHSERRLYFAENSELLSQKVDIALKNNLTPIFCIGENLAERNADKHLETVLKQLSDATFHLSASDFGRLIIAYEPVWAIGTGVTATTEQAQSMHKYIRSEINKKYGAEVSSSISILYGGSCNAQNAKELFACEDVDGGLIGGAALKAPDFVTIINSFPA